MAISFASATGNLFNVLGKCGLIIKQAKSYQTSQKPNLIDTVNGLVAQLNTEPDIQALVGSSYISILNTIDSSVGGLAQNVAQQIINRKVFEDNPRISQNLQTLQVQASIAEVIRQMKVQGASVLAMTVTGSPITAPSPPGPHFNGTGNGILNVSVKRPFDGLTLENAFAENILFTCIADSYLSGLNAGNEAFTVTGTGNQSDFFAFNWPLGSNTRIGLNSINGLVSNGQGNLLTNSGFDAWPAGVLSNWAIITGVLGTDFVQDTGNVYDGASSLKIVGNGATLATLSQQFSNSAGTLGRLTPFTQYSVCLFLRRDAVAAGAGNLTVELVGPGGVQIKDANGVANSFNIDLTALSTNYAQFTGTWRTPEILPSSQFIRLRLNTALTNGRSVFVDKLSMGVMSQLYTSGPFLAIHAGSIPFTINDYGSVQITNSRGAAGTLSTFQTLWAQLFTQMINQEFLLPSSATPTISDSLIG